MSFAYVPDGAMLFFVDRKSANREVEYHAMCWCDGRDNAEKIQHFKLQNLELDVKNLSLYPGKTQLLTLDRISEVLDLHEFEHGYMSRNIILLASLNRFYFQAGVTNLKLGVEIKWSTPLCRVNLS